MNTSEIDSIFRVLDLINRYETRQKKRLNKSQDKKSFYLFVFFMVAPFLITIALALSSPILGPEKAKLWSNIGLLITYLLVMLYPFAMFWVHRKPILSLMFNPFGALLVNAKNTLIVDLRYLLFLMKKPIEQIENVLFAIKAEKEFFERRISLTVGSIEKIGLFPGFLAAIISLDQITHIKVPLWVTGIAYAVIILYFIGVIAHYIAKRLDRQIKLLEMVISRKKLTDQKPIGDSLLES